MTDSILISILVTSLALLGVSLFLLMRLSHYVESSRKEREYHLFYKKLVADRDKTIAALKGHFTRNKYNLPEGI